MEALTSPTTFIQEISLPTWLLYITPIHCLFLRYHTFSPSLTFHSLHSLGIPFSLPVHSHWPFITEIQWKAWWLWGLEVTLTRPFSVVSFILIHSLIPFLHSFYLHLFDPTDSIPMWARWALDTAFLWWTRCILVMPFCLIIHPWAYSALTCLTLYLEILQCPFRHSTSYTIPF